MEDFMEDIEDDDTLTFPTEDDFGVFYCTDMYDFEKEIPEEMDNEWEKRYDVFLEFFYKNLFDVFEFDKDKEFEHEHPRGIIYVFYNKDYNLCFSFWEGGAGYLGFFSNTLNPEELKATIKPKMEKFKNLFVFFTLTETTPKELKKSYKDNWNSFFNC